jgi:zinc D-Ala-D-Ala carboxypeptidase
MDDKLYFIWKKGEKFQLSKNFSSTEFECKCKNPDCVEQRMSKDYIERLQKVRDEFGSSITITSGYRCLKHNRAIGSNDTSQHVRGGAGDKVTSPANMERLYKLCEKHFRAVGDARHRKAPFIHTDDRSDRDRRWTY